MNPRPFLVGLVGAGVRPSLTPPLHMAEASALGLSYVYRPIDIAERCIAPEQVGEVLRWARDLGFDALNITHPCKRLVLEHLDDISPSAEAVGAVNTVLLTSEGFVGHNTDVTGFAAAFTEGLPDARLDHALLLGAGGAGAAVGDALMRLGAARLTVLDVDADRSTALARDLDARHRGDVDSADLDKLAALLSGSDGLVHCTPTGMADHPGAPFDLELLEPSVWVADIVYRPLETALVAGARAVGCRVLDGGGMAVHQAVDAFALITGIAPDAGRMSAHFNALVSTDER